MADVCIERLQLEYYTRIETRWASHHHYHKRTTTVFWGILIQIQWGGNIGKCEVWNWKSGSRCNWFPVSHPYNTILGKVIFPLKCYLSQLFIEIGTKLQSTLNRFVRLDNWIKISQKFKCNLRSYVKNFIHHPRTKCSTDSFKSYLSINSQ